MDISVIIPHYAVGKMCAYAIAQLLKYKGNHNLQIVVVDNNAKDGSSKYLEPFMNEITYAAYPLDKLQSHGIAISWAIDNGLLKNEWFITIENDAFPIKENFIDYYENLVNEGYDAAVSMMKLSGGYYGHGCGALYSKSLYFEAKEFVDSIPYTYFPNMAIRNEFASHLMIHNSIVDEVLNNPDEWVELSDGYVGLTKEQMLSKAAYYSATNNPFHCGMGGLQENVKTYGFRTAETDAPSILLDGASKMVYRVGYEPMQYFYYWMKKKGKKIFEIPTETVWMKGRENQQQEYSITESGIKHLWAVSSYTERSAEGFEDVYNLKNSIPETLYNSLPQNQKIND